MTLRELIVERIRNRGPLTAAASTQTPPPQSSVQMMSPVTSSQKHDEGLHPSKLHTWSSLQSLS